MNSRPTTSRGRSMPAQPTRATRAWSSRRRSPYRTISAMPKSRVGWNVRATRASMRATAAPCRWCRTAFARPAPKVRVWPRRSKPRCDSVRASCTCRCSMPRAPLPRAGRFPTGCTAPSATSPTARRCRRTFRSIHRWAPAKPAAVSDASSASTSDWSFRTSARRSPVARSNRGRPSRTTNARPIWQRWPRNTACRWTCRSPN